MTKIFSLLFVLSSGFFLESTVVASSQPRSYAQLGRRVRVRRQLDCVSNGTFSDRGPELCSVLYYSCSNTAGKWEKRWFSCGRGKHYDPSSPTMCTPGHCTKKGKSAAPGDDMKATTEEPSGEEIKGTEGPTTTTTVRPPRPLAATDVFFSSKKLSWDNAMDFCVKAKATLLVIEEEQDNLFINSPASLKRAPYFAKETVWSSAKFTNTEYEKLYWEPEHLTIENFKSKNSSALKINWGVGEPSDKAKDGKELCVDILFSGGSKLPIWAASDCNLPKYFICTRKGEDRRSTKPEEQDPIEEPVNGYPGSLTIRGVNGDEKGIKLAGQLLQSNRSDYYYFYPEKRKLLPSPLLDDEDHPYPGTYKPTKSGMPLRAIDTITIRTNGSIFPMSNNQKVIFVQEGKFASGVFQPDASSLTVTVSLSAINGVLLLTPGRAIEFLTYDWHDVFSGPTPGKWKPEKITEYGDKPWAKAGHGVMKLVGQDLIVWIPDDKVDIPPLH